MKYETRKPSELSPYGSNARTHTPEQIEKIAASIQEFGFINPIIIDANNGVIAGHARLQAAQSIGLASVPVLRVEHLTEAQKRAYIIADNRLAEIGTDWDVELLQQELADLGDLGLDLELMGFGVDDDLFSGGGIDSGADGEVTEPPPDPVTKKGDIWILGKHRLMCGDSTCAADVGALMSGQSAHVVFTSPPYNAGKQLMKYNYYGGSDQGGLYGDYDDNLSSGDYFKFLISVLSIIRSHVHDDHAVFWNVSYNAKSRDDYGKIVFSEQNPFTVRETIIWDKGSGFPVAAGGLLSRQSEMIFLMSAGQKYRTNQGKKEVWWNTWRIRSHGSQDVESHHKACFPVELPEKALLDFSRHDDNILDVFGGTGTTMIAAENTGRVCFMMELSPAYCDVAINRWQTLTGRGALLESSGRPFDSLKK